MSEQQNRFQINTDLPEPTSPKKQNQGLNPGAVLLSPKGDGASKLLSQQSPSVMKNKLEVLKKLYDKTLDSRNALGDVDGRINQKRQQLDGFKTLLQAKLKQGKNSQESNKRSQQNKSTISDLEIRLQNLRFKDSNASHQGLQKISHLKSQIANTQQKIQSKQQEARLAHTNQINGEIQKQTSELKSVAGNFQYKKKLIEDALEVTRTKADQEKNNLQSLLEKLLSFAHIGGSNQNVSELESKQKNVQHQIYNRKQQIQVLKAQISNLYNNHPQIPFNPQTDKLQKIRCEVDQLKKVNSQAQKSVEQTKKQITQVSNKIKNNQKNIDKQKSKNNDLNNKVKKQQQQKADLQKKIGQGKQKPKYQQKVPEELIHIRKRKQDLTKDIKYQVQKTQKQRNQANNLVPPAVLENFRGRITKINQNNQRYGKLVVQNSTLVEQNKKLDARKQELEWEINPDLKSAQTNRLKQQSKCQSVEEEVSQLRKKNVQVGTKLQQYTRQYPEFKPQKKMKKQEPVVQAPVVSKKQNQQSAQDDKNNKKKKNKQQTSSAQEVPQPKFEEQKPAPVVQSGKNKKAATKKWQNISPQNKQKSPSPPAKYDQVIEKKQQKGLKKTKSQQSSPTLKLQSKQTLDERQARQKNVKKQQPKQQPKQQKGQEQQAAKKNKKKK